MTDVVPSIDLTDADEVDLWPNLPEVHEPVEAHGPYFLDMATDAVVSVLPIRHGPGNPPHCPPMRPGNDLIEGLDRDDSFCSPHAA